MAAPSIYTYHCICSHLVLATTRDIFKLPRRQQPGLDGAIIVPLPPPPRTADSDHESDEDDEDDDDNDDEEMEDPTPDGNDGDLMRIDAQSGTDGEERLAHTKDPNTTGMGEGKVDAEPDPTDYTLLLSSIRDKKPCIIRREDGFEKRLLWRCGRCRLIFGYQIYDETLEDLGKGNIGGRGLSKKRYHVYILPGGLTTAADMGSLIESNIQLLKED